MAKKSEQLQETVTVEETPIVPEVEVESAIAVVGAPTSIVEAEDISLLVPDVAAQSQRPSLSRIQVVQPMSQKLNDAAKAQGMKFGAQGHIALVPPEKNSQPIFKESVIVQLLDRYETRQMWPFDPITGGKLEVSGEARPICGSHNGLVPSARYHGKMQQDWRGNKPFIGITDGLECKDCILSKWGAAYEYEADGRIKRDSQGKLIKKLKPDGKPMMQAGPCRIVPVYVLYLPEYDTVATIAARNWTLQMTLDGHGEYPGIRHWFVNPVGRDATTGTALYRNMRQATGDAGKYEVMPVVMSVTEVKYATGTSYAPAFSLAAEPYDNTQLAKIYAAADAYRNANMREILTSDYVFAESEEDEFARLMEQSAGNVVPGTATPSSSPF
jgi:hypothetical protein